MKTPTMFVTFSALLRGTGAIAQAQTTVNDATGELDVVTVTSQ